MVASTAAIAPVAANRSARSILRLAYFAAIVTGLVGPVTGCTIVTNNCNVKDACPSGVATTASTSASSSASSSVPKP